MEKRNFKDGLGISLLGLGLMRLPLIKEGDRECINFKEASEIVDYAYKNGVNYFDTAYVYHGGESEVFAKNALSKYPRESYYIADKLPMWELKSDGDAERLFNEQLERLGVNCIDFYLMHALGRHHFDLALKYNIYDFMKKKQAEGKIRYIGFSFHDNPDVLREIAGKYEWDFAQIQLNYLDWDMQDAKSQYEILTEKGIPVIIMEPVRGGALADLCEASNEMFKTARPDSSIASWALRYAASLPGVMTVLSGMSNIEQVKDNTKTMTNFEPVEDEEKAIIEKAAEAYRSKDIIPCTGCAYCMPCPASVDIPGLFKLYNEYSRKLDMEGFKKSYAALPVSVRGENCIKCGACEKICPQGIKVCRKLETLEEISRKEN